MTSTHQGTRGRVLLLAGVHSPERHNTRDLHLYLPPSYDTSSRRYPVVYMQDGQNLFDPTMAFLDEWGVDGVMDRASADGLEAIIVGIPNMGSERFAEYSPFGDRRHGGGDGRSYLRFLIDTVKPRIDREFRSRPEPVATGILGSSMGGLISLYAFLHYSHVFGFAGVMSPALWFAHRAMFQDVEDAAFVPGRIYLDVGTSEGRFALWDVRRMRKLLEAKGYKRNTLLSYLEDRGGRHTERAWAKRLPGALEFLLPPS
jgi:predicted alpha/beta superfamily hydrolase